MYSTVMGLILILSFMVIVVYLIEIYFFQKYLEKEQYDIWDKMGRPSFQGGRSKYALSNMIKSFFNTNIYCIPGFNPNQLRRIKRIKWWFVFALSLMIVIFIAEILN